MKAFWLLLVGFLETFEALNPAALGLEDGNQICLLQAGAGKRSPMPWPATPAELPKLLLDAASFQQREAPGPGTQQAKNPDQQLPRQMKKGLPRIELQSPGHSRIQLTAQNNTSSATARQPEMDALLASVDPSRLTSVSEREAAFFKEQAREAKFEVDQLKAAGQKLLQQDELVLQQDESLRKEDAELRRENGRLEDALARLARGAALSSADVESAPEVAAILTALAAAPAEVGNGTGKSGNSTKVTSNSTAQDAASSEQTKKLLIYSGAGFGAFVLWVSVHLCIFFRTGKDYDHDGEVDLEDFEEYMARRVCCGMNASVAKGVLGVVLIASAGFIFLWWRGIIQPFMKELTCYVYLGLVLAALVAVIAAELWAEFRGIFEKQIQALNKLMKLFNLDTAEEVGKRGQDGKEGEQKRRGICC